MLRLLLLMLLSLVGSSNALRCLLSDILKIQNHNVGLDKIQGHWYASRVYGQQQNRPYISFTADLIRSTVDSKAGFHLKTSSRHDRTTNCDFQLYPLQDSSIKYVYNTPSGGSPAITLAVAAAHPDGNYALAYICQGRLTRESDLCLAFVALVVSKSPNRRPAVGWMDSIATTIPCYARDNFLEVNQTVKDDCFKDLKDGTIRQSQVSTGLVITMLLSVLLHAV